MRKKAKSKPVADWPASLLQHFDSTFADKADGHRSRLRQMLGRWLLAAETDDLPPDLVTPMLIERRTMELDSANKAAMKQVLFGVFGQEALFARTAPRPRDSDRAALARLMARNMHRLPEIWCTRATPMLHLSDDGLSDGAIIEARALSGVKSTLEYAWAYFDFCCAEGLPADLVPVSFRARVAARQDQHVAGRFSIYTMVVEATRLLTLGRDLFPERDWRWLVRFIDRMKARAKHHPTRANQRFLSIGELRVAAQQASAVARRAHHRGGDYRAKLRAHTLARTALTIQLLTNSPIRVSSLAGLDLVENFDAARSRLHLSPEETKDKKHDQRWLPRELRETLETYLALHRSLLAPPGETRLFIGCRGVPNAAGYLSQRIGDLTGAICESRVTAQTIRNIIAAFIVSEAPEEAGLVDPVLGHRPGSTATETYRVNGSQIAASQRLREATREKEAALGLGRSSVPRRRVKTRREEMTGHRWRVKLRSAARNGESPSPIASRQVRNLLAASVLTYVRGDPPPIEWTPMIGFRANGRSVRWRRKSASWRRASSATARWQPRRGGMASADHY